MIPKEFWGRDHKSTMLYIETRVVDHGGWVAPLHMRTDLARHPLFAEARSSFPMQASGGQYPTRLNNGQVQENHDDWDCVLDAWAEGLVDVKSPDKAYWDVAPGARGPIRGKAQRVVVGLTDAGWAYCADLRRSKGERHYMTNRPQVPAGAGA